MEHSFGLGVSGVVGAGALGSIALAVQGGDGLASSEHPPGAGVSVDGLGVVTGAAAVVLAEPPCGRGRGVSGSAGLVRDGTRARAHVFGSCTLGGSDQVVLPRARGARGSQQVGAKDVGRCGAGSVLDVEAATGAGAGPQAVGSGVGFSGASVLWGSDERPCAGVPFGAWARACYQTVTARRRPGCMPEELRLLTPCTINLAETVYGTALDGSIRDAWLQQERPLGRVVNLGNTCFVNAVVQLLARVGPR